MPAAAVSAAGCRCLSLWTGSANAAPPAGWTDPGFDDSAWPLAVAASVASGEPIPTDATALWHSTLPASATEQVLIRQNVWVPANAVNVTITLQFDDACGGLWVNGELTDVVGAGGFTVAEPWGLPIALFQLGAWNLIAAWGQNDGSGGADRAYVAYRIDFSVWEDDQTTDGADVAGGGDYGATLGSTTEGSGPTVRLVHASGVVDWEHDSLRFRVRSNGRTCLQAPFPTMTDPPQALLGKDPLTGIPMWTGALADYARKTDLPTDDVTDQADHIVVKDPTTGKMRHSKVQDPEDDLTSDAPAWEKPKPRDHPDNHADRWEWGGPSECDLRRCGAAFKAASAVWAQTNAFMVPMKYILPGLIGSGAVKWWIKLVDLLAPLGLPRALMRVLFYMVYKLPPYLDEPLRYLTAAAVATQTEFLDAGKIPVIAQALYPHLSCSDLRVQVDAAGLAAWATTLGEDDTHFNLVQRCLLFSSIATVSLLAWALIVTTGGNNDDDRCAGWDG